MKVIPMSINHSGVKPVLRDLGFMLLLTLVAYVCSLSAWFHGDDFTHLYRLSLPGYNRVEQIVTAHVYGDTPDNNYRPLTNTVFALLAPFRSAFAFRLLSLAVHIACGALLWGMLRRMGLNRFSSWSAACVFLVNPAIHSTVMMISALGDILATCFVLCAFYLYGSTANRVPPIKILAIALLYILGMMAKEVAIVFPAMLAVLALWRGRWRTDVSLLLALTGTGLLYFLLRAWILESFLAGTATGHYFALEARNLLSASKYAYQLLIPFPHHWVWQHPWLALVAMAPMGLIFAYVKKAGWRTVKPALSVALAFLAIPLLPVALSYANWYFYMPSIGWAMALGFALDVLSKPLVRGVVCGYILMCVFIVIYWGCAFIEAGEVEKRVLQQLHDAPEHRIAALGVPRQYAGVPMLTQPDKAHMALRFFWGVEKEIALPAPTMVWDLDAFPVLDRTAADRYRLNFHKGPLPNFFELLAPDRGASGWVVMGRHAWNALGYPTDIEVQAPEGWAIYAYEGRSLRPVR